jgi:hypothetical protein
MALLERVSGRALPPRMERIARAYKLALKVDPDVEAYWRLGVCNNEGEIGLIVLLANDRQVAAFIDEMVQAGFEAPAFLGSERMDGCHYVFECAREQVGS